MDDNKGWLGYYRFYEEHTDTWINELMCFPFGICYSHGENWFYNQLVFKFLGLELSISIGDW